MANEKRLIDANWILGEIEHDLGCYEIENIKQEDGLYVELRDVVKMVCAAPTVDAVPVVNGRWEDFCRDKMCCCSVCKAEFDNTCNEIHGEWYYCPNCGAKMALDG